MSSVGSDDMVSNSIPPREEKGSRLEDDDADAKASTTPKAAPHSSRTPPSSANMCGAGQGERDTVGPEPSAVLRRQLPSDALKELLAQLKKS